MIVVEKRTDIDAEVSHPAIYSTITVAKHHIFLTGAYTSIEIIPTHFHSQLSRRYQSKQIK